MMKQLTVISWILFAMFSATRLNAQVSDIRQDFINYGFPKYENCTMHLLPNGRIKFKELEESIANAQHYIHIEYYKWYNDSIGRHLLDCLAYSLNLHNSSVVHLCLFL